MSAAGVVVAAAAAAAAVVVVVVTATHRRGFPWNSPCAKRTSAWKLDEHRVFSFFPHRLTKGHAFRATHASPNGGSIPCRSRRCL